MNIYRLSLYVHAVGASLAFGATLLGFLLNCWFWRLFEKREIDVPTIRRMTFRIPGIAGIGFVLLLLSGVYMIYFTHGGYGHHGWFRAKMLLVVFVIINSVVFKALDRRQTGDLTEGMNMTRFMKRTSLNYSIQVFLLLLVILLGVFKFP